MGCIGQEQARCTVLCQRRLIPPGATRRKDSGGTSKRELKSPRKVGQIRLTLRIGRLRCGRVGSYCPSSCPAVVATDGGHRGTGCCTHASIHRSGTEVLGLVAATESRDGNGEEEAKRT